MNESQILGIAILLMLNIINTTIIGMGIHRDLQAIEESIKK